MGSAHRKIRLKNKIQKTNRTCGICGINPWPNYFFCPRHLEEVSRSIDMRDQNMSNAPTYEGVVNVSTSS